MLSTGEKNPPLLVLCAFDQMSKSAFVIFFPVPRHMYLQGLGYLEYFAMHSHRPICCRFTHEDYNIAFRFMFLLSLLFNLGGLGGPGETGGDNREK